MSDLVAEVRIRLGDLDLDVALTAAAGEVVGVLGPNGAGKTTLLRALAGLIPLDGGSVRLGDELLEEPAAGVRVAPERRRVGVVFQQHLLFPHLTAAENVAFGLRTAGVGRREARARAVGWLARVGLDEVAGARPAALSGGQSQRVALARALAPAPDVLLLDEPMAALDVQARRTARRVLREHLDGFAGPCVLVTHEPLEALALADTLVIVEDGRVMQDGPAGEVARRPRSAWVARLVGLNLYAGEASGHEVVVGPGTLTSTATAQGPVFAVVHPRAVALHPDEPTGSARNAWPCTVAEIDLAGELVRVHLAGPLALVAEITPAALADLALRPGGRVWAAVKATEVDLYPR